MLRYMIARLNPIPSFLMGQILGADSESEVIFHIRGQYQANVAHFVQFCLRKSDKHS